MRSVALQVESEDGICTAAGHEIVNGVRYSILAAANSWDQLKAEVQSVLNAVYFNAAKPDVLHLHRVHDRR